MEYFEYEKYIKYEPETGLFYRKAVLNDKPNHQWRIGETIGNITSNGYIEICVGDNKVSAHNLAWYMTYGESSNIIDHIDGDKQNNRIDNLRNVDQQTNQRNRKKNENNSSGFTGVYETSSGRWRARIKVNKKLIGLGTFDTKQLAYLARKSAEETYGFYKGHGER